MVRALGCSRMMLPARSRQMTFGTAMPMVSSNAMPARRRTEMSCGWVPSPTPRLVRSSALRSNTAACQPTRRSRLAANNPPSDPPITSARRLMIRLMLPRRSRQRPGQAVVAWLVIHVGLRRVAVDQRPAIHRVGLAARLMLDREQHFAAVEIDQVVEAILIIVAFLDDQPELLKLAMRVGKIGNVNLHVMPVVGPFGRVGLTKIEILFRADLHARLRADAIFNDLGGSVQHLTIEPRDARRGAGTNVETDVGHAKLNAAETFRIGRMHMDAIAPGANRLDAIVAFAKLELRSGQRFADTRQTIEERAAVGYHQSGHAAHDFRRSRRQMELAHADIDPHIAGARIEERIARQSEPADVVVRRDVLIADADIDVSEIDDIADMLRGAIVLFVLHDGVPCLAAALVLFRMG